MAGARVALLAAAALGAPAWGLRRQQLRGQPEALPEEAPEPWAKESTCLGKPHKEQQLRFGALGSICHELGAANFLIFGTGYDSPFWLDSNPHGHTRFLEKHQDWVHFQPESVQNATSVVTYTSKMYEAGTRIGDEPMLREFLDTQVPADVKAAHWDVILVDSPEGYDPRDVLQPGRGQSIYAARELAGPNTTIFLDDCHRSIENEYMRHWLLRDGRKLTSMSNGHSGGTICRISPQVLTAAQPA
mmetsp:Transcript_77807/g.251829  ORF Transcript_77807/g.251829 Transcript_77807/m.251829 type:complete len:245 (+) Transcript_77807:2-736(+)